MALQDAVKYSAPSKDGAKTTSAELFRGSADVPLNSKGVNHAVRVAKATDGQFTEIHTSPLKRALRTAEIVGFANPQAGAPQPTEDLTPWYLGEHEGKEVTPERLKEINDRIRYAPDLPMPGRSVISTQDGQSFNDFKTPVLEHVKGQLARLQPGDKILNVTHYRNIRLIRSWLRLGAPEDNSIDTKEMTTKGADNPGDLFHLNPADGTLKKVNHAEEPGIYFLRHGDTDLNVNYGGK